jgi:hypothetical protein
MHHLPKLAAPALQRRAERFVPERQQTYRLSQARDIERSVDPTYDRAIQGGTARAVVIQEPKQPLADRGGSLTKRRAG